ncbi:DUF814 domain-containing protein [Candidatus Woesearchaeota archaeon]|nr:DUF814 domain-containing protein [Candidatus Woesearchaeota archaeon]MBW3013947.1 DUF814 domain-containing protein [Candidatus Woesearchaeota archaeon]
MVEIVLDLKKNIDKNAAFYYEKAKKAKRKIDGAKKIVAEARKDLEKAEKEKEKIMEQIEKEEKEKKKKKVRKKEWYEKFRWFISSSGFLCIGGKDATTNDIIVKKHCEKGDLVFHTDIAGSPFFVIKAEGKEIDEQTKEEVATATAAYSRAWKLGISTTEVYCVSPDQLKHEMGLPKGTFMVYGKRQYFSPTLKIAVGMTEKGVPMGGPVSAVKKHCKAYVTIKIGDMKKSEIAKRIQKKIGGDSEDIMPCLPTGGYAIVKE